MSENNGSRSESTPTTLLLQEMLEQHQRAYQDGFANIYSLEKIDVRTIRRIGSSTAAPASLLAPIPVKTVKELPSQEEGPSKEPALLFDSDLFVEKAIPFILQEPIHSLDLSVNVQKTLIEQGLSQIGQLVEVTSAQWLHFKGIGQGHVDEIKAKISHYLQGQSLAHMQKLDSLSFLKTILGDLDRFSIHVLLAPFDLDSYFPINTADKVKLKHLNEKERVATKEKAVLELLGSKKLALFQKSIKSIANLWLDEWIGKREGFISLDDLVQRLQQVSLDSKVTSSVFKFLSEIYCHGQNPFFQVYISLEEKLIVLNQHVREQFILVVESVLTYFYHFQMKYEINELICFCRAQWALQWVDLSYEFVYRVLRLSKNFRVRRDSKGSLSISVS